MEDIKGAFASRAVWGGIVAVLAGIAGIFGYTIDPALQGEIATQALGIAAAVGGVIAIWGRLKATKKIG